MMNMHTTRPPVSVLRIGRNGDREWLRDGMLPYVFTFRTGCGVKTVELALGATAVQIQRNGWRNS